MEGPPERERGAHLHLSMRRITNCRVWFVMVQTVCGLGGKYSRHRGAGTKYDVRGGKTGRHNCSAGHFSVFLGCKIHQSP